MRSNKEELMEKSLLRFRAQLIDSINQHRYVPMNHNDPYLALALLPPRATTSRANPYRASPPRAKETMPTYKEYGYGVGSAVTHGKCLVRKIYLLLSCPLMKDMQWSPRHVTSTIHADRG